MQTVNEEELIINETTKIPHKKGFLCHVHLVDPTSFALAF